MRTYRALEALRPYAKHENGMGDSVYKFTDSRGETVSVIPRGGWYEVLYYEAPADEIPVCVGMDYTELVELVGIDSSR